jgi:plasmid stability protein
MIIKEGLAAMTVILNLDPEVEKSLTARAQARGVSLDDYIQELVAKEAGLPVATEPVPLPKRFDNLSDLLLNSPLAGANLDLERSKDYPRPVDLA